MDLLQSNFEAGMAVKSDLCNSRWCKICKDLYFCRWRAKPKNTVLNPMLPPPYTVGEPKPKERYDEAKRHPVFADSFEIGHEPIL